MKKLFIVLLMCLSAIAVCYAVPACPFPEKVMNPDGSFVTIRLIGDEFLHYSTTEDGYTVVKNDEGYYVYALESDGNLLPSEVVARDEAERTDSDLAFLKDVSKYLAPAESAVGTEMRSKLKSMTARPKLHYYGRYDYTNFRGLVILVEYNDCSFIREDAHNLFDEMINTKDYTGFMSTSVIPVKVPYTGSVRDYYYDNSMGKFDPVFDVVGPVKIDYSQYYVNSTSNASTIVKAAVNAADSLVNYADYDRDGDGAVDMVYFIFAGAGSNFSGNDSRLIWPHASTMSVRLDGVNLGRYACSTELYGKEASQIIDGIGTVCHEFSHVLGLPDEYDTDYASSGGQSIHPAKWSVMASGSYLNQSRTPVGYSLYERYSLLFATPEVIEGDGSYTLNALNTSNSGYRINSAIDDEFFIIENRQQTRWDEYLPGHGMLIFRVDSTDVDIWEENAILS